MGAKSKLPVEREGDEGRGPEEADGKVRALWSLERSRQGEVCNTGLKMNKGQDEVSIDLVFKSRNEEHTEPKGLYSKYTKGDNNLQIPDIRWLPEGNSCSLGDTQQGESTGLTWTDASGQTQYKFSRATEMIKKGP